MKAFRKFCILYLLQLAQTHTKFLTICLIGHGMFCYWLVLPALANEPVLLKEDSALVSLTPYMEILEDPTANLNFEAIVKHSETIQFTPPNPESKHFGFTSSAYWVRFQLKNMDAQVGEWLLEFDYPLLDEIELFVVKDNHPLERQTTGDTLPFLKRDLWHHNFLFSVKLFSEEQATIYIRVKSESAMQLGMQLWSQKHYIESSNRATYGLGLYYGIMLVMVIYNLFIFLSIRDRSYLYYVLYISSYAVMQMAMNGLAFQYLWPDFPWWANKAIPVSMCTTMLLAFLFAQSFLNLPHYLPKTNRVVQLQCVILGILTLGNFFISYALAIKIAVLFGVSMSITLFYGGLISMSRGSSYARFYVMAWSALLLGVVLNALRATAILPPMFITNYAMQIGSSIEVVLLSLGLANRINILRKEKLHAQVKLLEAREATLLAQKQAHQRLEVILEKTKAMASARDKISALSIASETLLAELPFKPGVRVNIKYQFHHLNDVLNFQDLHLKQYGDATKLALDEEKTCQGVMNITPEEIRKGDERFKEICRILNGLLKINLWHNGELLAMIQLQELERSELSEDEVDFIRTLAQSLAISLDNINFNKELQEKARMETELRTAGAVQHQLLPRELPQLKNLEFASYYKSASETGGDWYGFINEIPNNLYLLIGDVTGHGTPTALMTASANSACRILEELYKIQTNIKPTPPSPAQILYYLNFVLHETGSPQYQMTLFIGRIDLDTGLMEFVNAGHNHPMIVKADGKVTRLLNCNIRLGEKRNQVFKENQYQLENGDLLFLFTDGLTENPDPDGQEWGERGLLRYLRKQQQPSVHLLINQIVENMNAFLKGNGLEDDVTLLACKVTHPFEKTVTESAGGSPESSAKG